MSTFTAVVHKEDDLYVAQCPEAGTASQGETFEEAVKNLQKATEVVSGRVSHKANLPPDSDHLRGGRPGLNCRGFQGIKLSRFSRSLVFMRLDNKAAMS